MASSLSGMFFRAIQTVKPHVPLIKFRKGGHRVPEAGHSSGPAVVQASAARVPAKGEAKVTVRPTIEDYQLPQRYRRLPLDESEINAINSGGAY
ncbi:28S ribosomal protein S36, mitochondrial isoform X1 [Homalodisca vitripennis]|uniref:28S ribosomal protein S36, mitochondrial isoform X1 n=1 Tax=Homalodisca vitripennis TaxID=197043 RepID=UPI001EE9C836|nr:28S ribosomal protein S36, mitochondrial isoform X1 [Homalodisca vitripennis]